MTRRAWIGAVLRSAAGCGGDGVIDVGTVQGWNLRAFLGAFDPDTADGQVDQAWLEIHLYF